MRSLLSLIRDRRDAAGVEFALGLPLMLCFVWGLFEYGRTLYAQTQLDAAAGEAVLALSASPATDDDALEYMVLAALPQYDPSTIGVDVFRYSGHGQNYRVMTLTLHHEVAMPFGASRRVSLTSVRSTPIPAT